MNENKKIRVGSRKSEVSTCTIKCIVTQLQCNTFLFTACINTDQTRNSMP